MLDVITMTLAQLTTEADRLNITNAQIVAVLQARIVRDQAYLRCRKRHGRATTTDVLLAQDLPLLAAAARALASPSVLPFVSAPAVIVQPPPHVDTPISITGTEHITAEVPDDKHEH